MVWYTSATTDFFFSKYFDPQFLEFVDVESKDAEGWLKLHFSVFQGPCS